jgi:ABC-type bacteriocin/lantibiotic exporter with double-glycine peptidase domain
MKKQQKDKKVKKDRREKLRYIREVSAEQRGRILLSCLTGILGVAFALAFIYATKRVIDTATGITDDNLTHVAVLTVVLLTAQLLCGAADTWISTRMQIETGNALRHRLFSRLLQSRWNELERFHTGDVVNRRHRHIAHLFCPGIHRHEYTTAGSLSILLLFRPFTAMADCCHPARLSIRQPFLYATNETLYT